LQNEKSSYSEETGIFGRSMLASRANINKYCIFFFIRLRLCAKSTAMADALRATIWWRWNLETVEAFRFEVSPPIRYK
jgi:hypothetical protein